jgi:DNA-binding NarL/FixJ family response regulator
MSRTETAGARALIADDHALILKALANLLSRMGIDVVAEAGDGAEAVRLARETRPDIALVDLVMPRVGGIEATRQIRRECPETRVVILSGYVEDRHVAEAVTAGASAVITKGATFREIRRILDAVRGGAPYDGDPQSARMLGESGDPQAPRTGGGADVLTPREREILRWVAGGYTSATIASHLLVSPRTVEQHRKNIMNKLGIHSRVGLTRFALENG